MTERLNPRDRLRALAANLDLPLEALLGELMSEASQSPAAGEIAKSIPLSDAAIRAAISESYSTSEIGLGADERDLLDQSQVVMIGGRRRLRLSDEARGAILREASGSERYAELLREATEQDRSVPASPHDEVAARSACLRRFLDGTAVDLKVASTAELRASVAALKRLRGIPLAPNTPTLADAQRQVEYAELLEPLRISIGATGPWNQPPSADRFVGREKELTQLRKFVDEIDSEGALESVQRGIASAGDALLRGLGDKKVFGVRYILALGGLGKSALIAKFVLDHALKQGRPFPFAYLDFDRAAIQPRDPRQLLLEVARQVALQFADIAPGLGQLRERIRQSLTDTAAVRSEDPFEEFRTIVTPVTHGERALLIVLDTIEIVQADPAAMQGLLAFLERLARGGLPELRLVAAGRAEAPELVAGTGTRRPGAVIKLEPLSHGESAEMVRRLGLSLIPSGWNDAWMHRLAGKSTDPPERREPLSLRVAVETLRDEAPANRDARSIEIEALGEDASTSFVGKLYMNRVVGHVAGGEDVRKLAWPGLVLRRVSVPIIQELLAPVLGVQPSRAQELFDALATQLWIVVRDGDGLRHQQDLRARTLPLMRRKDEFGRINAAAIAYFGDRKTDPRHRAEWIYHRLLGGESPESVDTDWTDAVVQYLKDAHEDFVKGSPAADYLAAHTSDRLQSDQLIARLDPHMAIRHLARAGLRKASLTDRAIDPLLVTLPMASVPQSSLSGPSAAVRIALCVKTGRWREMEHDRVDGEGPWQQQAVTAIAFRRARMILSDDGRGVSDLERLYTASGAIERAAPPILIQDLAASRMHGLRLTEVLDSAAARLLERGVSTVDTTIGLPALRTAMAFGRRATLPAARLWIAQITEQARAGRQLAMSAAELRAMANHDDIGSEVRKIVERHGSKALVVFSGDARKRFDDPKLIGEVAETLRRRCERGAPDDLHALRAFAAARDEDWLLPLAYAAYRATGGQVPEDMAELYETHQPETRGFLQRNVLGRIVVPTDIVEVLARADEASDLARAAELFARGGDERVLDLKALLAWHHDWREGMASLLDRPE